MHQAPAAPAPEAEERAGTGADTLSPGQVPRDADAVPPVPPIEVPALAGTQPAVRPPGIAQAFSALFAAERGEAPPPAPMPGLYSAPALPQASLDDLVEQVAQRVLERLSDRVVRDTVTDIVSRVSERLVREEIDRVKATLK